jgi:hypothetical protein
VMTAVVPWRAAARRRLTQARPDSPRSTQTARVVLPGQTMIRHASNPGAVTAVSFGVRGAAMGGCLITSASLPLAFAADVPGAVSHAINLVSIAPPANKNLRAAAGTQEHTADHFVITCGQKCSIHANITLRDSQFRQYRLRQIPAGPGFRGCPIGPSCESAST